MIIIILTPCIQARFPDGHRLLLFPVKCSEVREVGVAEAKLDTSVVLSHGIWTGRLSRLEARLYYTLARSNVLLVCVLSIIRVGRI